MKESLKRIFRSCCPDIPALRKMLGERKIKSVNRYTVKEDDIVNGEKSRDMRREIVGRYSSQWTQYGRMLGEKLDEYVSRCEAVRDRGDLEELKVDILFNCYAYGFLPDEYFAFDLENKTPEEKRKYISNRDRDNYVYRINDIIDIDIFYDKYRTYEKYRKYYKRDAICVRKKSDYRSFCEFVDRHPVFVKKNVRLSKGESVELVDSAGCGKSRVELFNEMLGEGRCIVEECVRQSEVMGRLNRTSVNTVRCMTFRTKNGIEIGPCFLKAGQGGSFVDNGGQGGILTDVDSTTGRVLSVGYDEFRNEYPRHPDTGIEFRGFQIPQWDELTALSRELAGMTPSVRYIGWDLAHTDDGWVVIEGNGSGQFIVPQIVRQKGIKDEILELIGGME